MFPTHRGTRQDRGNAYLNTPRVPELTAAEEAEYAATNATYARDRLFDLVRIFLHTLRGAQNPAGLTHRLSATLEAWLPLPEACDVVESLTRVATLFAQEQHSE